MSLARQIKRQTTADAVHAQAFQNFASHSVESRARRAPFNVKNHAKDLCAGLANFWKVCIPNFCRLRKPLILRDLRHAKIFHKLLAQAECVWQIDPMKTNETMTFEAKIISAAVYGMLAFKAGKKRIPALDRDLLSLLTGNRVEDGHGVTIINAWLASWDSANLSAPIGR